MAEDECVEPQRFTHHLITLEGGVSIPLQSHVVISPQRAFDVGRLYLCSANGVFMSFKGAN